MLLFMGRLHKQCGIVLVKRQGIAMRFTSRKTENPEVLLKGHKKYQYPVSKAETRPIVAVRNRAVFSSLP